MSITVHGWAFSPFVRAVRIGLEEKGQAYRHVEMAPPDLDTTAGRGLSPFHRVPIFEHGDTRLLETPAILAYIDEALPGPPLQPATPAARAKALMLTLAAGHYFYPSGVMGVFLHEVYVPENGGTMDPGAVETALAKSKPALDFLAGAMEGDFLVGNAFSLADLAVAPMVHNFAMGPRGRASLAGYPQLHAWSERLAARASFAETRVPVPRFGL